MFSLFFDLFCFVFVLFLFFFFHFSFSLCSLVCLILSRNCLMFKCNLNVKMYVVNVIKRVHECCFNVKCIIIVVVFFRISFVVYIFRVFENVVVSIFRFGIDAGRGG